MLYENLGISRSNAACDLGYASKHQIHEFVEQKFAVKEENEGRLFSVRNPDSTERFATYVFNRVLIASGVGRECNYYADGRLKSYSSMGRYQSAVDRGTVKIDNELGVLIDLNHFDQVIGRVGLDGCDLMPKNGVARETIAEFMEQRRSFLTEDKGN